MIAISNPTDADVNVEKIFQRGFTTRESHAGQGLNVTRQIVDSYRNCAISAEYRRGILRSACAFAPHRATDLRHANGGVIGVYQRSSKRKEAKTACYEATLAICFSLIHAGAGAGRATAIKYGGRPAEYMAIHKRNAGEARTNCGRPVFLRSLSVSGGAGRRLLLSTSHLRIFQVA